MSSASSSVDVRDPGLQAERTALAWTRTAFAVAANAMLILRAAAIGGSAGTTVLGCIALGGAGCLVAYGMARQRMLADPGLVGTPPPGSILGACAIALAACAGGVLAVLAHGVGAVAPSS